VDETIRIDDPRRTHVSLLARRLMTVLEG
jgi:hypothetical protein